MTTALLREEIRKAPAPPLPCKHCGQVPEFYCEGQMAYLCCERLSCDNVATFGGEDPVDVAERWNEAQK